MGKLPYDPHPFRFHAMEMDEEGLKVAVGLAVDMKNGANIAMEGVESVTKQVCEQLIDNWIYNSPEMENKEMTKAVYSGARRRWEAKYKKDEPVECVDTLMGKEEDRAELVGIT